MPETPPPTGRRGFASVAAGKRNGPVGSGGSLGSSPGYQARWRQTGVVRRRLQVVLDANGNGTVTFEVRSANDKWIITSCQVYATAAPYPNVTVFIGGQQTGVSEGSSWSGNRDTLSGESEMTAADDMTVSFNTGLPGATCTAIIEGRSYLWS